RTSSGGSCSRELTPTSRLPCRSSQPPSLLGFSTRTADLGRAIVHAGRYGPVHVPRTHRERPHRLPHPPLRPARPARPARYRRAGFERLPVVQHRAVRNARADRRTPVGWAEPGEIRALLAKDPNAVARNLARRRRELARLVAIIDRLEKALAELEQWGAASRAPSAAAAGRRTRR